MSGLNGSKKAKKKEKVHLRTKYIDPSRRFLEWVNDLGFEQTQLGRIAFEIDKRFNLRKTALLFLFCLFLSFLLFSNLDFSHSVDVGDVAATDIKSPISIQIVDEVATEKNRIESENSAPPVFDFDSEVYEGLINRNYDAFRSMREKVQEIRWAKQGSSEYDRQIKQFLRQKPEFEKLLGSKVSNWIFEWLVEQKFSVRIENVVRNALIKWRVDKIVDGSEKVLRPTDEKLIVREVDTTGNGPEYAIDRSSIKDLNRRSEFDFSGLTRADLLDKKTRANTLTLAKSLLVPNLTFNRQETALRRQSARTAVLPVQISIDKNQTIVNAGAVIQPIHLTILSEIENVKSDRRVEMVSLVSALLFVVLVLVLFSYMRRFTLNKIKIQTKEILVMGLVAVTVVCLTKLFLFMTDAALIAKYGSLIPAKFLLFMAPVAAGPMLVGLLITSGELVWLYTIFQSVVLSTMVDMNFNFLIVSFVGGIAAARGVYECEKRNDIYFAGVRTGVVNALVIIFVTTLGHLGEGNLFYDLAWLGAAGLTSGIMASLVAMMLVPLLESIFNIVTDVKLLELSNLNHPLMKELFIKAPGTYHHSLSVGSMVEAAAKDIEANALLGKVMAYYHDIGKMEHAQYFVENQRPGFNPHDNISPHLSKTIIIAHVKDGAEMGLVGKLGKPIIDGILQHHGTTLISYFYNKALEEQDEDIDTVEKGDFRYPGPKPQFKEAALVMLADSIEAAARCIDEPTTARLTTLVKNIIQSKFMDGQLDECNLTFKDLTVIERKFTKTLLSIYHHRIDYPSAQDGKITSMEQKKKQNARKNITAQGT